MSKRGLSQIRNQTTFWQWFSVLSFWFGFCLIEAEVQNDLIWFVFYSIQSWFWIEFVKWYPWNLSGCWRTCERFDLGKMSKIFIKVFFLASFVRCSLANFDQQQIFFVSYLPPRSGWPKASTFTVNFQDFEGDIIAKWRKPISTGSRMENDGKFLLQSKLFCWWLWSIIRL